MLVSQSQLFYPQLNSGKIAGVNNISFCHMGSWYQVETRARVIFFDKGTVEADGALQRWSASRVSQAVIELPRNLSREHGGLLSWPESLYKARGHNGSPDESDKQPISLSAKAMELSIYGSMVCRPMICFMPGFLQL